MKKITIAGIATLIILLSSGTTYYIQDLGEKTGCRRGWNYVDSGEFESYYSCSTKSAVRYQMCFEVYDSANTPNYWCKKGFLVSTQTAIQSNSHSTNRVERCTPQGCEPI